MRTRVLMFGWEFPPFNSGGLGIACLGLVRALSQRGFEIIFVMPKRLDIRSPWARFVFADTLHLSVRTANVALSPYLSKTAYRFFRADNPMYGFGLLNEVHRYAAIGNAIAADEQFDIIYAHDWLSFGAGIEAKRATGKPLIVHVHATEFDRCGGPMGVNHDVYEIERRGMDESDIVIAVSEFTKRIIVSEYGIPEWKVRVVHNGIDEITEPQRGAGLPRLRALKAAGNKLVLFLGRVTLQKGPDYFVRAAKKVCERNSNVYFILSGSGDMQEPIMNLAAHLGIADHVLFTGFLDGPDKREVYTAADLFVMPSVSEPFGITALEAMKLGTPVLISKQSGVSEVVKHALKVDFWDVDEMANKILGVIGYPGLKESLSQHGQREAERATWADAAAKVDNIVHELVA